MMADGEKTDEKERLISMYLEQLNVSHQEFQNTIKKSITIFDGFNKNT